MEPLKRSLRHWVCQSCGAGIGFDPDGRKAAQHLKHCRGETFKASP